MENIGTDLNEKTEYIIPEIDFMPGYVIHRSYTFKLKGEFAYWRVIEKYGGLYFIYGDPSIVACFARKKEDNWVIDSFEYEMNGDDARADFLSLCFEFISASSPNLEENIKEALLTRFKKFGNPFLKKEEK